MRHVLPLASLAIGALCVGATLLAQDEGEAMPRPAPEHAMLKERVGTWDAAFKMNMDGQAVEDKATMTYSMLGDFWLLGEYEGKFMGAPFHGREMSTFDPASGQFVLCWIDSTSPSMVVSKGTWDPTTKTMTQTSTEVDPMWGVKSVYKTKVVDPNTIQFSMTPEGAAAPSMEIAYKRRL
jgi:hypothetical protein